MGERLLWEEARRYIMFRGGSTQPFAFVCVGFLFLCEFYAAALHMLLHCNAVNRKEGKEAPIKLCSFPLRHHLKWRQRRAPNSKCVRKGNEFPPISVCNHLKWSHRRAPNCKYSTIFVTQNFLAKLPI